MIFETGPQGKGQIKIPKSNFSIFIVLFDWLTIIILLWYVGWLDDRQKTFVEKYQNETIEMPDFTIRFEKMPANRFFEGKEKKLKWALYDKISRILVDEAEAEEDPNKYFKPFDEAFAPNKFQVVDINLAKKNIGDVKILTKLEEKS